MLHLLDANALIDARRDYYPLARVPEFWFWLRHMGAANQLKVPLEIYEEITEGNDDLAGWIRQPEVRRVLLLDEEVDPDLVSYVVDHGYATDLTDDELPRLGNDPFLIAHALTEPGRRRVITTEVSKPRRRRANRRIPDVCRSLGAQCNDTFFLIRELNFSTDWREPEPNQ